MGSVVEKINLWRSKYWYERVLVQSKLSIGNIAAIVAIFDEANEVGIGRGRRLEEWRWVVIKEMKGKEIVVNWDILWRDQGRRIGWVGIE